MVCKTAGRVTGRGSIPLLSILKERGVAGSIAVSKIAGLGSNPSAPAKALRRVRITVLQQSRKLPGSGP